MQILVIITGIAGHCRPQNGTKEEMKICLLFAKKKEDQKKIMIIAQQQQREAISQL